MAYFDPKQPPGLGATTPNTSKFTTTIETVSISSPLYLVTGSSSGTISILPQAAAGTYNFNLPITAGTNGYFLTSAGGGSSAMTWTNPATSLTTSITATAPLTANGASGSAQTGAVTVALTTPLALQYGGTNANLTASNGGIFYSTATAGAILAGTATNKQVLLSGSSSAPSWSTATYLNTTTANQILYSSSNNIISEISASNNGVLISNASGVPSWLAAGSTGQVLIATTGSPPSWGTVGSVAVTSITGTANQIAASSSTGAVTLSLTNGISIGSYQATSPPSGGIILPGKAGFGVSSIGTNNGMEIGYSNPYSVVLDGTITSDDGSSQQIGLKNSISFTPSANGVTTYGISNTPVVVAATATTIPNAYGYYARMNVSGNIGTISNAISLYIENGSSSAGTVSNGYSAYINSPAFGSTRFGLYVTGADADGNSPGCRRLSIVTGTMTGDDGTNQYGIFNNVTMRPTSPSRSTFGLYSAPYAQPHSTNTIDAHFGGAFLADGTVGSGAVSFGISLRAYNPNVGTTKIALYADNVAIGTATAPPSNGLICSGRIGVNISPNAFSYFQVGGTFTTGSSNRGHFLAVDGATFDYATGGSSTAGRAINIANGGTIVLSTGAGSLTGLTYAGVYCDNAAVSKTGNGAFTSAYGFYSSAFSSIATNQYNYYSEGPTGGTLNVNFYGSASASGTCFYAKCPDTSTDAFFTQDGTNNGVSIRNDASNGIVIYGYQNSISLLTISSAGAITAPNGPIKGDRLASNSTPSATSGTLRTAPGDNNGSPSFSVSTSVATWQNTNDYDVLVTGYATSTSGAVFSMGVGTTSSPTVHAASPSLGSGTPFFFSAFVPASYYVKVSVGAGTLTVAGNYSAV